MHKLLKHLQCSKQSVIAHLCFDALENALLPNVAPVVYIVGTFPHLVPLLAMYVLVSTYLLHFNIVSHIIYYSN